MNLRLSGEARLSGIHRRIRRQFQALFASSPAFLCLCHARNPYDLWQPFAIRYFSGVAIVLPARFSS